MSVAVGVLPDIRTFRIEDYPQALRLWQSTDEAGLSDADSLEGISRFLARNPSLSFVAVDDATVVATVLCGHDGRRGLIHHLVVASSYRRKGLGRALVSRALTALHDAKIEKCHLLVFRENDSGRAFWKHIGGEERISLATFSLPTADGG
jgi:N-acetylglutamate synthase